MSRPGADSHEIEVTEVMATAGARFIADRFECGEWGMEVFATEVFKTMLSAREQVSDGGKG